MRALFTAATGMNAQQVRIDAISNNLANVNTTGFKSARAEFQDLFYETLRAPGAQQSDGSSLPTGVQVGHGVRFVSTDRVFHQGEMVNTGQSLDLAIEGDGFFQVQRPTGETAYTRDGSLKLDGDGNLVTSQGLALIPAVTLPTDAQDVTILDDGTVTARLAGSVDSTTLGQLDLARFTNPAGLRALGGNLFAPTDASGDPEIGTPEQDGFGGVSQGFLESSNVNIAEELVQMILAQRAFELNSRVIQAGDEMMQTVAQVAR